jgi:hypothetical protein
VFDLKSTDWEFMNLKKLLVVASTFILTVAAQDQRMRLSPPGTLQQPSNKPSTNNYQFELQIEHSEKAARYRIAFSGGQISTDLIDRSAPRPEGAEPRMISLQASFTPFEEGNGAEATLFISRPLTWKSLIQAQPSPGQPASREVVNSKSVGLTTKAALFFDRPVVLFDDGEEKITVKLEKVGER